MKSLLFSIKELDLQIKKSINNLDLELGHSKSKLLHYIKCHKNVTQRELEEITFIPKSSLSESLTSLEKEGYVIKENRNDNNKNNYISLTDKGNEYVRRVDKIFSSLEKGMLDNINEEELLMFLSVINKIKNNIRKDNDRDKNN